MAKRLLLVEGSDDLHVVRNLLAAHDGPALAWRAANGEDEIKHARSDSDLLKQLGVAAKGSYDRLGAIIDANDKGARKRYEEVARALEGSGIALPENADPSGTVVATESRLSRFGLWIMPDNRRNGALEDFLVGFIPENDTCWGFAREATGTAIREHCAPCPERYRLKAEVRTWLAWQKEPGRPPGQAIGMKYFDVQRGLANVFVDWVNRVFGAD